MTTEPDRITFPCKKCAKRLKAPPEVAGKYVRCPKCKEKVQVPNRKVAKTSKKSLLDEPLALDMPAISDRHERDKEAKGIRDQKQMDREITRKRQQGKERPGAVQPIGGTPQVSAEGTIPFDDEPAKDAKKPPASLFDEELPDLNSPAAGPDTVEDVRPLDNNAPTKKVSAPISGRSASSKPPASQTSGSTSPKNAGPTTTGLDDENFEVPDLDDIALQPLEEPTRPPAPLFPVEVMPADPVANASLDDLDDLVPDLGEAPVGTLSSSRRRSP